MADPYAEQAIRRRLHTHPSLPVYAIPPLGPNSKGYTSASWLHQPPMATVALEIIETSTPIPAFSKAPPSEPSSAVSRHPATSVGRNSPLAKPSRASTFPVQAVSNAVSSAEQDETISVAVHLLDPTTRELFAAAPYTHPSVVTPCTDSGRYFSIRVADDSGRKATLGVGFERREEAFEFVAALGSAGKVLGFDKVGTKGGKGGPSVHVRTGTSSGKGNLGSIDVKGTNGVDGASHGGASDAALFALEPPPPSPAVDIHEESLVADQMVRLDAAHDYVPGIEDDEFGDFQ